jgi:hypothetical protein
VTNATGRALALRIERQSGCTIVSFTGELDQASLLDELGDELAGVVVFDMDGVGRISSAGVHRWVNFVRELAAVTDLSFVRCRPAFINQVNFIYGFVGKGAIATLYLPYLCEPCNLERLQLVDAEALRGCPLPGVACPECGGDMDFDEDPVRYFAFLSG